MHADVIKRRSGRSETQLQENDGILSVDPLEWIGRLVADLQDLNHTAWCLTCGMVDGTVVGILIWPSGILVGHALPILAA